MVDPPAAGQGRNVGDKVSGTRKQKPMGFGACSGRVDFAGWLARMSYSDWSLRPRPDSRGPGLIDDDENLFSNELIPRLVRSGIPIFQAEFDASTCKFPAQLKPQPSSHAIS